MRNLSAIGSTLCLTVLIAVALHAAWLRVPGPLAVVRLDCAVFADSPQTLAVYEAVSQERIVIGPQGRPMRAMEDEQAANALLWDNHVAVLVRSTTVEIMERRPDVVRCRVISGFHRGHVAWLRPSALVESAL